MSKKKAVRKHTSEGQPIQILHHGVNVAPLVGEIEKQPELWDQNRFRTYAPGQSSVNPHQRIQDIIVRFNDWRNWTGDRMKFNERHESVWWAAYEKLPYVKPLVFDLMRMYEAESLGMVLITRIPPHCEVAKHTDAGWHAQQYLKFAVQLKSAPSQKFCYDGYSIETAPGDLYAFDNSKPHWVENPTDQDRWTLIICLRLQQEICRECKWTGERGPTLN